MQKAKRKIKNFILKTITWLAGSMFFVSASAVDSESYFPTIICLICMAWLGLFAYANGYLNVPEEGEKHES